MLARVGGSVEWAGQFTWFLLCCLPAAVGSLARPGGVIYQLQRVVIGSLGLVVVTGVALGAVIWMHTHTALTRTGMVEYLPTMLAVAVLLELAPIGAGLIVAARSGAALGAELGSMKIGEQIDALELLGIPAMDRLVGPRVLACMLALPVLNALIAALAIGSGFVFERIVRGTYWFSYQAAFLTGPQSELYLADVIPAMLKTVVFGFLIGATGCFYGLRASGGTEGVGAAATNGVVWSCLLVLFADVALVALIQVLT